MWVIGILIAFLLGMLAFRLWEAFIGFNDDYDTDNGELFFAPFFWWIIFPVELFWTTGKYLKKVKQERIATRDRLIKVRIAAENEVKLALEELDAEEKKVNSSS